MQDRLQSAAESKARRRDPFDKMSEEKQKQAQTHPSKMTSETLCLY